MVILGFLIVFFGYKKNKKSMIFIILFVLATLTLANFTNIWSTQLFNLTPWKFISLGLLFVSFFIVLNLIDENIPDIYVLNMLVLLGSIILVLSDNLLTLYLGLELQTFSTFILVAKNRSSIKSSEAGLKYFILGAISSGFYLLGIVLLFLFGFDLNIKNLVDLLDEMLVVTSFSLISLSFCFKLTLFPLHFWIPDIYEGSSWDVITLLSTLPKVSVLCVVSQMLVNSNVMLAFSLISIGIGTLGALNQNKFKRLLAYSGISHMGFILLGYSILNNEGFMVSNFYLLIYILTMVSVFILIVKISNYTEYIIELSSVRFTNKLLSATLLLLILSIAGIPPLSGFLSKWFLIWTSIEFKYNISAIVVVLFSITGASYYLRIVKILYFQRRSSYFTWQSILISESKNNEISYFVLGSSTFFVVFLMLNFSSIINITNWLVYSSF